jgi:hypothetical protein
MRTGPITRDASTVQLGLSQIRIGRAATYITSTGAVLSASDSLGAMASTSFSSETEYFDLESGFPLSLDATFPMRETNMLECAFKEITPKSLAIARGMDPFSDLSAAIVILATATAAGSHVVDDLVVDDDGGVVTDTWNVVFTDATNYKVYGQATGLVGGSSITAAFAPDNGGNPYFTIPANHFSGTWAADEGQTFGTVAYTAGSSAYGNVHAGSIPLGTIAAPKYLRVEAVYTFPDPTYKMIIIFPRANVTSSLSLDQQPEDIAAVTVSIKAMGASSDTEGGNAVWDNMPNGLILFTGG